MGLCVWGVRARESVCVCVYECELKKYIIFKTKIMNDWKRKVTHKYCNRSSENTLKTQVPYDFSLRHFFRFAEDNVLMHIIFFCHIASGRNRSWLFTRSFSLSPCDYSEYLQNILQWVPLVFSVVLELKLSVIFIGRPIIFST